MTTDTSTRRPTPAQGGLVPANAISGREEWALRLAHGNMTGAERREMLDFLGYPEHMPHGYDLLRDIVLRILDARARGVHIA